MFKKHFWRNLLKGEDPFKKFQNCLSNVHVCHHSFLLCIVLKQHEYPEQLNVYIITAIFSLQTLENGGGMSQPEMLCGETCY